MRMIGPIPSFRMTALLLLFLFCLPQHGNSQTIPYNPVIKFAGVEGHFGSMEHRVVNICSYKQILNTPLIELTSDDTSRHFLINSFSISFFYKKEDRYVGPYAINGPKVQGQAMEMLQKLSNDKVLPLRIFIDDMKVFGPDGMLRNFGSISFDITN